jgi:hypothetical protein
MRGSVWFFLRRRTRPLDLTPRPDHMLVSPRRGIA